MSVAPKELIGPLLRDVSRSFYLTLRVLPPAIRSQISVAYLLARASDTIADTDAVPRAKRVMLLQQYKSLTRVPDLGPVAGLQASPAERQLLEQLADVLGALDGFAETDCRRIQELLAIIVRGQIFDLQRFPEGQLTALTADELDQYTYMVAGCVGEFWTQICAAHLPDWPQTGMAEWGVRLGKGLQLVNILRDLPKDLRIERCYLPVAEPERLLEPASYPSIRDLYQHWLDVALGHLDAGWEYTRHIPKSQRRLRLACVWPIWIGVQTIARLRTANPLDPAQRIKITRREVYRIIGRSLLLSGSEAGLTRAYQRLRACK